MSRSGREALPDVREWLGSPSKFLEVVGRPSQMYRSGRETLINVGTPSWMSRSGRETL